MWTILVAVATALYICTEFESWGMRTFGLFGWWSMAVVIGAICGLTTTVIGHLLRRSCGRL